MPDVLDVMWHHTDTGSGRPLVLLHGIGMSHTVWAAVIPALSRARRVLAFDLPGFGATPPLPSGTAPTIANLVDALARSLSDLGLHESIDVAGNSLGGVLALEAARRGLARRAVAISPIGLWERGPALHVRPIFAMLRFTAMRAPGAALRLMRPAWLREAALAVPLSVGSRRMTLDEVRGCLHDLARATAFEATFEHTHMRFDGRAITVPVTVAFGDRDWILTPSSRRRDWLPPHTIWISKRGWGHVPMWADPAGVAQLIADGCS